MNRARSFAAPLQPVLALFFRQHRGRILAGMTLAAVTILAGVALLGVSGWFITATAIAGLSAATALAFDVFAPAAAIRFLALARTAARYGERLVTHDATLAVLADLRERLFRGWAGPGAARQLLARPAKLLFRLTADIDALDSLYLRVLVPAAAACAVALVAGLVLGLLSPWLGLAFAAVMLLGGFGLFAIAAHASRPAARRRAYAVEALRARTVDLTAGQTELAMAGRLADQCAAVIHADHRLAQADEALNRIDARVAAGYGALSAVLMAGMLVATFWLAQAGRMDAPLMAMALLVALGALEPFGALRRGAVELGRTLLAARRIAPRLVPDAPLPRPAIPPAGIAVQANGLAFRHPGAARDVLSDICLTLAHGERIAIVGPSGAGKSTLLALIAGEIVPSAGLLQAEPATLLTQRTELFEDTIAANLRLAAPEKDDPSLLNALDVTGLASDVSKLRLGLETRLGEGGMGLSGGQARRLALARLLLRDTPLWLLDEPTEGLDGATAADVLTRLREQAGGRSLVIATHIRREAELADQIIIMENGRITARLRRGGPGFASALNGLRPD
ncbi:thiol reductant ABC exporter subunit CydC [Aquabacter sp. L1I39]|uniref:thiol reductant ABC exporter subunit CydC n=1 Tax=Aquabacter sp. L1I39 TaxID=2820278 RepID=UPI001ADB8DB7|nr:thiol reductant ABC exporter subunit CydC [Aquabacter sp. L1I39]QTL05655.1 thiol reductant ABC exporter subunit CydC [Aquabacter sp. L1I39]